MWQVEINGKKHPTWISDDIYALADKVELWKIKFKPYGVSRWQLKEKENERFKKYGIDKKDPFEKLAWELISIFDDNVKPIKYTKKEKKAQEKFLRFDLNTKVRYWNTTQHRYATSFDF